MTCLEEGVISQEPWLKTKTYVSYCSDILEKSTLDQKNDQQLPEVRNKSKSNL